MNNRREQLRTMAMAEIHKSAVFEEATIQRAVDIVFNAIYPDVERLLAFQDDATMKILELEDRVNGIFQQVTLTKYTPEMPPSGDGDDKDVPSTTNRRKSGLSLVTPPAAETPAEPKIKGRRGSSKAKKESAGNGKKRAARRNLGPITDVRIVHDYVQDDVWKEVKRISRKSCDTPEELETAQQFFYHLFAGFEARVGLNYHDTVTAVQYFFPYVTGGMLYGNGGKYVKQFWHGFQDFKNGYEEFLKHSRTYGKNLRFPVVEMDSNTKRPKPTVSDPKNQNVTVTNQAGQSRTVPVNPTQTSTIQGSVVAGGIISGKDTPPWDEQPTTGGQKNEKKEVVHA